ncbi:MAG: sigma-70 family RNA polymerase sigma factor [Bacillota bacterium]|nr:sigma-70 family RNA polymerase sigma factor [Bacillota bacterium]
MISDIDEKIIQTVLEGDVNAFEVLVTKYEKTVYNLALRMTGNAEDAADMTQETFFKAFRSLKSYRGESRFSVWLYRICSNVCLDLLRSKSRKPHSSLTAENDEGEEAELEIPDGAQGPEEQLLSSLTRDAIQRGLDSLPAEQKEILLLREISGLSYEEISLATGLELGTVKTRIFRARKRLCAFLIDDGNIPEKYASVKNREVKQRE